MTEDEKRKKKLQEQMELKRQIQLPETSQKIQEGLDLKYNIERQNEKFRKLRSLMGK